jgi:hypothetical protein
VSYAFQAIERSSYEPLHETIGEATARRFPEKYAARPMTENEDTCERCGYIRDCYSTASNAHDNLCDLRADGACEQFASPSYPAGGCTTCGWERGYHEGATME